MNAHLSDPDVEALLTNRIEACRAKDIDRLMSLYSPDIVYFDVVPPLQFVGADAVRQNFVRWFDEYDGPIALETHDLAVVASADLAVAHMLHRDTGSVDATPDGSQADRELWLRSSVCCRRFDRAWLITHEHISLPVDLATMQALPGGPGKPSHP